MTNLVVAEKASIELGTLNLECYLLPDGEYVWSMTQISEAVGYGRNWLTDAVSRQPRLLKALQDKGLSTSWERKVSIPVPQGGYTRIKAVTTEDAMAVFKYAARQQKEQALDILEACLGEALDRRADTAFGKRRSEEEYQQRTKARELGKVTRRFLTNSIQDYDKRHLELSPNTRSWLYKTTTDKLYKLLFNQNAKQLRELLNTKNPRDKLSAQDLLEVDRIENLAMKLIDGMDMYPPEAIDKAFRLQLMVAKQPDIVS